MNLEELLQAYKKESKAKGARLLMDDNESVGKGNDKTTLGQAYNMVEDALQNPEAVNGSEDLQNLKKALDGNFSAANELPALYKDFLMTKEMLNYFDFIDQQGKGNRSIANADVRKELDKHLMDPVFQTGLELIQSKEVQAGKKNKSMLFGGAVSYMNSRVLENTLAPVSREELKKNPAMADSPESSSFRIDTNRKKQTILATQLMLAHLAGENFKLNAHSDEPVKNTATMADVLSHGGRTVFELPAGPRGKFLMESLLEKDYGKELPGSAIMDRSVATHDATIGPKVKGVKGLQNHTVKEKKSIGDLFKNYGMNLAIGGYGKEFGKNPDAPRMLLDAGDDGHMYMKLKAPSEKEIGYMMIGIEGEKPHGHGHYGHEHNASASKSAISAFGATKHGVGSNVDGRTVNLTGFDQEQLISTVNAFQTAYSKMSEKAAEDPAARHSLEAVNRRLAGAPMTPQAMVEMMEDIKFPMANLPKGLKDAKEQMEADQKNNPVPTTRPNPMVTATDELVDGIKKREQNRISDPAFGFFQDRLESNKRKFLKFFKLESDEMKNVRKALDAVTNSEVRSKDDYQTKIAALKSACDVYLHAKKANNNRKTIVQDLFTAADNEGKRLSDMEKNGVKRANFEELAGGKKQEVAQKVEAPKTNELKTGKKKDSAEMHSRARK